MNYSTFVNKDFSLVPFAVRLLVLGLCGNHIVERSRLTVAVNTEFCIGVVGIVKHLIFGSRDINRLELLAAVLFCNFHFLSQIEDTGVAAFVNLPFQFELEVA